MARSCARLVALLCAAVAVARDAPAVTDDAASARVIVDGADAVVRRTDGCGAQLACGPSPVPPNAVLPDVRSIRLGRWAPTDALLNPYAGVFAADGGFVRIDLVFSGLMNPPGPMTNTYQPRLYGPNPVIGFLELDVDTNGDTGGEVDAPLVRYAGNAARFGGRPAGQRFTGRVSVDGRDPDNIAATGPWLERSGADFELELRGDEIAAIVQVAGDSDLLFEANETWDLQGRFFRRAQGYDDCAGGAYGPRVWLRFSHCDPSLSPSCAVSVGPAIGDEVTVVSFVYPLTNLAYAEANGLGPEANDVFDFNANSILEGLYALEQAAQIQLCPPTYEWWPLMSDWQVQQAADYLDPHRWRVTMLWGTARPTAIAGEGNYIWTDIHPDVVRGDFNGDGFRTRTDARMANGFVSLRDGDPAYDADLTSNGVVELVNFGVWFSVYDVDYDGFVGALDVSFSQQAHGDYDNDGDVDMRDYGAFQACCAANATGATVTAACRDAFDAGNDGMVGIDDFGAFVSRLTGP